MPGAFCALVPVGFGDSVPHRPEQEREVPANFGTTPLLPSAVKSRVSSASLPMLLAPLCSQGILDRATGEVNLEFCAEFVFTAGPLYTAQPLQVG